MFHTDKSKKSQTVALKDLSKIQSPAELFAHEKRQALLTQIQQHCFLEEGRYKSLVQLLLDSLANMIQSLPETHHSFYANAGGLVDHALHRTEAALALFNQILLLGAEKQASEEQKLWQYALLSAGLLKGLGKLYDEYEINLFDGHGQWLKKWNPLQESLATFGKYYDYVLQAEGDPQFRKRLNLLLARQIIPASGFSWIASNRQVFAVWLALLNEDPGSAGTLGAIFERAEALVLQRYLQDWCNRLTTGRGSLAGRSSTFTDSNPLSTLEREQQLGAEFMQWLMKAIADNRLTLEQEPLFTLPGGMLMSQALFQHFLKENPQYKNWLAVQKGVMSLTGSYSEMIDSKKAGAEGKTLLFKQHQMLLVNTAQDPLRVTQQLNAAGQWQQAGEAPNQSAHMGVTGRG